jgi:hypothetical protein
MLKFAPIPVRVLAVTLIVVTVGLALISILGSLSAGWNFALRVAAIATGVCDTILIVLYRNS